MGRLAQGVWFDQEDQIDEDGQYRRQATQHRDWITADGDFQPEAGRYHLYVSLACPWAHRTLIYRRLKGLESLISVSVVSWLMAEHGWTFDQNLGSSGDALQGLQYLHQLYTLDSPDYSGRVTVPVLWDRKTRRIVNNESADIIRIFNAAFDELTRSTLDLYPTALQEEIDRLNSHIYDSLNNGVYRAGFATRQGAYEEAFDAVFATLDELEGLLDGKRYLAGEYLSEADWRLFTTLVRFDAVYHGHFKCNLRRISDYPNLHGWLRELYQWPGIAETVDLQHIKRHYYQSHRSINANGIVPKGPQSSLGSPHGRERLPGRGIFQGAG
ncbi:glutathione S-transferase family protein [Stutzerimonas kirkiae]|uniref:glutathione S-transferase family protein n=1 Tax=Stutzerimonas kirkiae TaxID=2211392 RepID=UPI0010383414|nr:glutathione S-transferase family protein [Stutzerimonas kirkiae]TBV13458.1 glutathione-dependent reductase [Stutzerimonas kirkiae]